MLKRACALLIPLALVLVVSCNNSGSSVPGAKVEGKVTYKGQTVTGGTLIFHAGQDVSRSGTITPEGTYKVEGVPPGEVTVTVETESLNNKKDYAGPGGKKMEKSPMPESAKGGGGASLGTYVKIPAKYSDKNKSDLKFSVKDGPNHQDLDLKD